MLLNDDQRDALTEAVNVGVGRAAASLSALVEERVELRVPRVRVRSLRDLQSEFDASEEPVDTSVVQGFSGEINGRAMLAFPRKSGVALAKMLSDDSTADRHAGEEALESDLAGVLEEIGNIVLNGVLGSLANAFENRFQYTVPELCTGPAPRALARGVSPAAIGFQPTCLIADAHFELADSRIGGSLLLAFNTEQLGVLLDRMLASASI